LDKDCIFCKIASGQIGSDKVYSDDKVVAFRDISPQAPSHIIIIPRQHIGRIEEAVDFSVFSDIFRSVNAIIKGDTGHTYKNGFRVVANSGMFGGQTVDHLHFHLLAGRQMLWPPG